LLVDFVAKLVWRVALAYVAAARAGAAGAAKCA